jgi:ATP:corrinoid adenosyltransferase
MLAEYDTLQDRIECQRLQLTACAEVSLQNLRNSKRLERTAPYWSQTYKMVADAVDREINHREQAEKLSCELQDHKRDLAEAKKQLADCQSKLGEKRLHRIINLELNYKYDCCA